MGVQAEQPDNDFTRMIARNAERNRGGGADRVEGPVTAGPQPNVRSAAYGVQPLSVEERMELDALAMAAGIMPASEEETGPYASQAEAEAIGAPINPPREQLDAENVLIDPAYSSVSPLPSGLFARPGRHIPVNGLPSFPKLPDFSKPGILDLDRGVVYLDGLEFPIPAVDLAEFRAYVVTTVAADIQSRLTAALAQYAPVKEAADGGAVRDEDVRQVQEDAGQSSVQSGSETA